MPQMLTRFVSVALGGLLACVAPGCLTVDDDDGPLLSIELFWDTRPGHEGDDFFSTCDDADVVSIEWTLYRVESGRKRVEVDSGSGPCLDLIEEVDLPAGDYEIDVTGFDENDEPRWQAVCGEPGAFLTVVRFDVAYFCDIEGVM